MTMDYEEDGEQETNDGLVTLKSISPAAANRMVQFALAKAVELKLSKIAIGVMGIEGFMLASVTGGGVTPNNDIALRNKLETVIATRRSIHKQISHMKEKKIDPANYGDAIKTLFIGGLAVYADVELTQFVGAIAASGGTSMQDVLVAVNGVDNMSYYTDDWVGIPDDN